MAGSWSDADAIAAGLYDAPGSKGAADLKAATDRLKTGASDLYSRADKLSGASPATPATTGQPEILKPSTWKIPAISDVVKGMMNGPGTAKDALTPENALKLGLGKDTAETITSIQNSFADWIPRIIIMLLGFIFVAVGLAMFGIRPAQEIVNRAREHI